MENYFHTYQYGPIENYLRSDYLKSIGYISNPLIFNELTRNERRIYKVLIRKSLSDIYSLFKKERHKQILQVFFNKLHFLLKKKIKTYKIKSSLKESELKELKKIFDLFNIDVENQVAYVRSTYNEDLEFLNFLLFNINDDWERYDEIEHLKNKFFNHEIKFEGIFKKQSNDMLNEYINIALEHNITDVSKLSEKDWRQILTEKQFRRAMNDLFLVLEYDIYSYVERKIYASMKEVDGTEIKPSLSTVLKCSRYQKNAFILLQKMKNPKGMHKNDDISIEEYEFLDEEDKKRYNKIEQLQAICIDFDFHDNTRFKSIDEFKKEVELCLYAIPETGKNVIPTFLVSTEHGIHAVWKINSMPYTEDNLELWKDTTKKIIDGCKNIGLVADKSSSFNPVFTIRLPFMRQQKKWQEKEYRTSLIRPVFLKDYLISDLQEAFSDDNFKLSKTLLPKRGCIIDTEETSEQNTLAISTKQNINQIRTYNFCKSFTHEIYAIKTHDIVLYAELLDLYSLDNIEMNRNEFIDYINKSINMHDILGIKRNKIRCLFHLDNNPSAEIVKSETGNWRYICYSNNCEAWFTNLSIIQKFGDFTINEALDFLAEVLKVKIRNETSDIHSDSLSSTFRLNQLKAYNEEILNVFDLVQQNHHWIKSLREYLNLLNVAFYKHAEEQINNGKYFYLKDLEYGFAKSSLRMIAIEFNIAAKSEAKISDNLNILHALGFIKQIPIPDWNDYKGKFGDVSRFYHYKHLTENDRKQLEARCKMIEDYCLYHLRKCKPSLKDLKQDLLLKIFVPGLVIKDIRK